MKTASIWQDELPIRVPKITVPLNVDVVVIGGGITGVTAAFLLKRAGKKVCLVERDKIGGVDTAFTTAHLTMVTDYKLSDLVKTFGREKARLAWEGGAAAINTIEAIVRQLRIECEFRRLPGFWHASLDDADNTKTDPFRDEAALANELGFSASFVSAAPYVNKPAVRFANQAKFNPLRYLAALTRAIEGAGSYVYEHSEVSEISEAADQPLTVVANGQPITCDYVVVATHVPLAGKSNMLGATLLQSKLASFSSYVIGAWVPKNVLPEAIFWDTASPYHYLRVDMRPERDYAIFGGCDHKTGQIADTEQCYQELEAKLRQLIPQALPERRWSGQVVETNDGLPFIGESAERQFIATGFAGNGMTFGTLAAMMACDAYLERANPWQDLFDVGRKSLRGGWDYLKQNFDYPYYVIKDRLIPVEAQSTRSVKRGEGRIIKTDQGRVACYRDENGKLTQLSPVCTHMGCIVHWNTAESTWDCPCHGSRFKATGEVMAGPAEASLETIKKVRAAKAEKQGEPVHAESS